MMSILRLPQGFCRCEDLVVTKEGAPSRQFSDLEAGFSEKSLVKAEDPVVPSISGAGGEISGSARVPNVHRAAPVPVYPCPVLNDEREEKACWALPVGAARRLLPEKKENSNSNLNPLLLEKKPSAESVALSSSASTTEPAGGADYHAAPSQAGSQYSAGTNSPPSLLSLASGGRLPVAEGSLEAGSHAGSQTGSQSSGVMNSPASALSLVGSVTTLVAKEKKLAEKARVREMVKAFTRDAVRGIPCKMLPLEGEVEDGAAPSAGASSGLASAALPVEYAIDKLVSALYLRKRAATVGTSTCAGVVSEKEEEFVSESELSDSSLILHWLPLSRLGGLYRGEELFFGEELGGALRGDNLPECFRARAKRAVGSWGTKEISSLRERLLVLAEAPLLLAGPGRVAPTSERAASSSAPRSTEKADEGKMLWLLLEDMQARDRAFSCLQVLRLCSRHKASKGTEPSSSPAQ